MSKERDSEFDFTGVYALVTGASSGLGATYANALASRGAHPILVARRRDRLEALAARLRQAYAVEPVVLVADLSERNAALQVRAEVDRLGISVDVLVNNAGFGTYGPIQSVSAENDSDQVMVNVHNLVAMCHAFVPDMIGRDRGLVINVASIAAFQPVPYMSVYGASKAFILSYTEALWFETRRSGVRISSVCPGATETEFFAVVGNDRETLFGKPIDPAIVVEQSLKQALAGAPSSVVGVINTLTTNVSRVLPRRAVLAISGNQTAPRAEDSVPRGGMAPQDQR